MNRLAYWPEGKPGSQSIWGAGDRNVKGTWPPGSNLLLSLSPAVILLGCGSGQGWAEGCCVVWKNSYPSLFPFEIHWSTIHLIHDPRLISWVFLKPPQKSKKTKHEFYNSISFYLFRSGQQKSYKEQKDSWISKPYALAWCKPRDWDWDQPQTLARSCPINHRIEPI